MPNKHEPLTKYVFAERIDRGGPGIAPEWAMADPTLNRFYLAADVDALLDDPQALAAYLVERKKGRT